MKEIMKYIHVMQFVPCPMCHESVDETEFDDNETAYIEFTISGLCLNCQEETFSMPA